MELRFRCKVGSADLRAVTEWLRVLARIVAVLAVVVLVLYAGISPHDAHGLLGLVK